MKTYNIIYNNLNEIDKTVEKINLKTDVLKMNKKFDLRGKLFALQSILRIHVKHISYKQSDKKYLKNI